MGTARRRPSRRYGQGRPAWLRGVRSAAWAIAAIAGLAGAATPAAAQDKLEVAITYVTRADGPKLPPLSLLEPRELPDEGLAGATARAHGQPDHRRLPRPRLRAEPSWSCPRTATSRPRSRSCSPPASASSSPTCCRGPAGARRPARGGGRDHLQRPRPGRRAAHRRLPAERVPHHPEPRDEGGRARPVPGLEALEPLVPDPGRAPGRSGVRRGARAGRPTKFNGEIVEERTYAYAPTSRRDRDRPRPGAAADAGLHPGRARLRRPAGRRRERRVRRVPALPDLGAAAGRRHPGADRRPPGIAPTSSGPAPRCRAGSRSTPAAGCASATTPPGSGCARSARR